MRKVHFSEPGGAALSLGRAQRKPYSQSAQVFSLSGFVLNSVFRTSPKLQSDHKLQGQIDPVLHQSCTQSVVSCQERHCDTAQPARWDRGENANLQARARLNCILFCHFFQMSLDVIKIPQTVEQTCQSHRLPTKESVGIIHVQHFWKKDRQTVQVPKQAVGQATSKRQAIFFARRDYFRWQVIPQKCMPL